MTAAKAPAASASLLLACLQDFGAAGSNAVLDVLDETPRDSASHKLPGRGCLDFAGAPWRAFYHCHQYPERHGEEHGHFHLFTRVDTARATRPCRSARQAEWCHLAGLSMDRMGQPRAWLAMNGWVTDGPWLPLDELLPSLQNLEMPEDARRVERWLLAMVAVFREDLVRLLELRDAALPAADGPEHIAALDDRRRYVLAELPIDLLHRLQGLLL